MRTPIVPAKASEVPGLYVEETGAGDAVVLLKSQGRSGAQFSGAGHLGPLTHPGDVNAHILAEVTVSASSTSNPLS